MSKSTEYIPDEELLARFVLHRRHVRADGTVKPDAFIPPRNLKCSVTRHDALSENEIWQRGQDVAAMRKVTLYGRADVKAETVHANGLQPEPVPLDYNPEHCEVIGWASDKPSQKMKAIGLAVAAAYTNPKIRSPRYS